ncbi:MAG: hypothetical protein ACLR8Y_04335 [Alistipes indistinctus]
MKYDFDEVISREGTNCEKLDARERLYGRGDVIPLWVADMEFAAPPAVLNAIRKRAEHPILGYSYRSDQYWNSIIGWVERRSGWKIKGSGSTLHPVSCRELFLHCVLSPLRGTGS